MTVDRALHLPWFNAHKPFVAFHWTKYGSHLPGNGKSYPVYHFGFGYGRLFVDRSSRWRWFTWTRPWSEA